MSLLSVSEIVGADGQRWWDMIVETTYSTYVSPMPAHQTSGRRGFVDKLTGFVIGDNKKGVLPLGAIANSLIDLLNEKLSKGYVTGWVHRVCIQTAARGVDIRELGKKAEVGILEEVLNGNDVGQAGFVDPAKELGVVVEGTVGSVVLTPTNVLVINDLEDTSDVNVGGEIVVVEALAGRRASKSAETVGVCWLRVISKNGGMTPALLEETYARNTGVPIIEGGEFINNVHQSRDISLIIVVHDLLSSNGWSQSGVADELLVNEALERG
jgi:hypothetical protein